MPVKRREGKAQRTALKRRTRLAVDSKVANLTLPTKTKGVDSELVNYMILFYGATGIGKSSAAASFPNTVFLGTEPGLKHLDVAEFNSDAGGVTSWEIFRRAIELLVGAQGERPFTYVAIDTVDRAYDLCAHYVCRRLGIDHVSQDSTGKRDRSGRGWTELKKEFITQIYRIRQAGYGVIMTSHYKMREVENPGADSFDIVLPSMSGQALGVVQAITDFMFYVEYMRDNKNQLIRVMITEGDDVILAKHRGKMPRYLPFPNPEDGGKTPYEIVRAAFQGENVGIDPRQLSTARSTAKATKLSLAQSKLGAIRGGLKKVTKLKNKES